MEGNGIEGLTVMIFRNVIAQVELSSSFIIWSQLYWILNWLEWKQEHNSISLYLSLCKWYLISLLLVAFQASCVFMGLSTHEENKQTNKLQISIVFLWFSRMFLMNSYCFQFNQISWYDEKYFGLHAHPKLA